MVVTIFKWGGLLAAIKYGTMMATTGLCVSGYKRRVAEYNSIYCSGNSIYSSNGCGSNGLGYEWNG